MVREVGPMVGLGRQESSYTIAVADLNQVGAQCLDRSPRFSAIWTPCKRAHGEDR